MIETNQVDIKGLYMWITPLVAQAGFEENGSDNGINEEYLHLCLRDACLKFIAETCCYVEKLVIPTQIDICEYKIPIPEGYKLNIIRSVALKLNTFNMFSDNKYRTVITEASTLLGTLGDTEYRTQANGTIQIGLNPKCDDMDGIEVYVSYVPLPTKGFCTIPENIYYEWGSAIASRAVYKALMMQSGSKKDTINPFDNVLARLDDEWSNALKDGIAFYYKSYGSVYKSDEQSKTKKRRVQL